jgi:hypothetical protein
MELESDFCIMWRHIGLHSCCRVQVSAQRTAILITISPIYFYHSAQVYARLSSLKWATTIFFHFHAYYYSQFYFIRGCAVEKCRLLYQEDSQSNRSYCRRGKYSILLGNNNTFPPRAACFQAERCISFNIHLEDHVCPRPCTMDCLMKLLFITEITSLSTQRISGVQYILAFLNSHVTR